MTALIINRIMVTGLGVKANYSGLNAGVRFERLGGWGCIQLIRYTQSLHVLAPGVDCSVVEIRKSKVLRAKSYGSCIKIQNIRSCCGTTP